MQHWVIFDAMGVIFTVGDDTNELLVPFVQRRNPAVATKQIQDAYLQASLGQISAADFWQQAGLGEAYPQVEQTYLDTCLQIDPHFKETAAVLSQKVSLAILSNDVKEWSAYLRRRFGLEPLFREALISGEAGCRKPSPEIYKILLERLGAPAQQCIFIDDRVKNLIPAREIGMHPVWYQRKNESGNQSIPTCIRSFTELPGIVDKIFATQRT